MSGQLDDAAVEATTPAAVAGPEGTPSTAEQAQAEVDWQKRYSDLQPEYTRATQRVSELERQQELYDLLVSTDDPDTRRQVAERLGYVLDAEEQTQEGEPDPFSRYDERLDRIEQALTARDQQEANATRAAEVREQVDARLDKLGIDKDDQDWVLAYAINALPPTQDGLPDVEQAHQVFAAREDARQKAWAQSKRAPAISPNGQAATEVPDLDDRQQRWEYMARRINANEQVS
jgi:hypothetical protein